MKKRFPRILLLMVTLTLILVVAGCAAPSGSPPPPSAPYNSDTELPRFVKRCLTYPGSPYGEPEILVGELPGNLPVDVPVPRGAEVIGSIVHSDKYTMVEIMLDVPQEPDEVLAFYRDRLTEKGWQEMKQPSPSGFVSPMVLSYTNFCLEEKFSLNIRVYPTEEGKLTDVRLNVNDNPQFCNIYTDEPPTPSSRPGDVLPALLAPDNAIQMSGGGGGGGDQRYSQAMLETSLSIAELHTHYRTQLIEAGWKLEEEGGNGTVAWSAWTFIDNSDNDWVGLLHARAPKEDCRILWLSADLVP